jgi:hypothetical protein
MEPHQEMLKKISSASSSWQSQSSASSRDDMLVESSHQTSVSQEDMTPAVPRSRIRIRIHVLETIEQIVAQNGYEREVLELLKKQSFSHVKIFEPLFLNNRLEARNEPCVHLRWLGGFRRHHRGRFAAPNH